MEESEKSLDSDFVVSDIDNCRSSSERDNEELGKCSDEVPRGRNGKRKLPARGTKEYKDLRRIDAKRRRTERGDVHKCPECDYTAPFPSKIRNHILTRHTEGRFKCKLCEDVFNTISEQRNHTKIVHRLIHVCDICKNEFDRPYSLKAHFVKNHILGVKCTVPGCTITLMKRQLKRHLADFHSIGTPNSSRPAKKPKAVNKCSHCDYQTDNFPALEQHIEHSHTTGIKCPMVDCEVRVLLPELEAHFAAAHSDPDPDNEAETTVSTPEDDTMSQEGNPDNSQLDESLLEPLSEQESERNQPSSLEVVPKEEFNQNDADFICGQCDARLQDLYNLKKHIKAVHAKAYKETVRAKKHPCTFDGCSKAFTTIGLLEDHLNIHNDVKPYHCDHCEQSFHARARFAVHLSKYHQMSIRSYDALQRLLPS